MSYSPTPDSPAPEWRLLEPLRPTERAAVLAATTRRRFGRGDTIFFEGDPGESVHLLATGRVAIRAATPGGDTVTYAVAGPGDAFGEMALLGRDNRRTATVLALEPVETFVLLHEQFEAIRDRHPGVDRMLVEILAQRVRRLSAHLLEALHSPVEQRVVRRLLTLCWQYGGDAVGAVSLPLTQTDLAELAGATRPTVNRVLRALEADGAIALARGRIDVRDRAALRRAAG
jgi:CRP-like cAMP-binding protein